MGEGVRVSEERERRLRAFLDEVVTGSPEFGSVRLWSQWLELVINYDGDQQPQDYKSIYIHGHSIIRYADDARSITFTPPINDLSGSVPSVIFGLEGERITAIEMIPGLLTVRTAKAIVALTFNDGPGEAIHIGRSGEADPFIL